MLGGAEGSSSLLEKPPAPIPFSLPGGRLFSTCGVSKGRSAFWTVSAARGEEKVHEQLIGSDDFALHQSSLRADMVTSLASSST